MLQYRIIRDQCSWRAFGERNATHGTGFTYATESLLHELFLQSEHRTLDPEEADFFYVPVYASCWFHPGWCVCASRVG